jgi:phage repressor protein C with HTH and peptisase S24 domain
LQYPWVIYLQVTVKPNMGMDKFEKRRRSLKALVESLGHGGIAKIADSIGKAPSYVSRMLYEEGKSGKKNIGEDSWDLLIAAFSEQLGARHQDVEDALQRIASAGVSSPATRQDYVRVDQLNAEGDMGEGRINDDLPEVVRAVDFTPSYIRALVGFVPAPGRLKLVSGRGDSMRPTIMPGDTVLVDMGCDSFDGDGLYLVNSGHGQQIKRLQDRGGTIHVVSDNAIYAAVPVNDRTAIGGKVYLIQHLERVA